VTSLALRPAAFPWRATLIALGLSSLIVARWAATVGRVADPVVVGATFGLALLAVAFAGGLKVARPSALAVGLGLVGGLVLVGVALAGRFGSGVTSTPPSVGLAPWAVATIIVATAEEAVLRGALFDAVDQRAGTIVAVAATSVVFALMHVPLYGWQVVPLDLGVGLWLAGLRLLSGGIAAPAVAHALADLATWWL
jgi:membrane protease YdiL (CAAX protease family)